MRALARFALFVVVIVVPPHVAFAQSAPAEAPASGWDDGFVLASSTGDYRLQFNGLFQVDGRFALQDSAETLANTFVFRRARPMLQGRVARHFEFNVQPDFAGGTPSLRTAYVETRLHPALRIRVGKDKEPFGLERLQSSTYLLFVERALPSAVAPDRDLGLQVLGDLEDGLFSYAAGVFNGVVDGGSSDTDTNDEKDIAGRIVVRPFARRKDHLLARLSLALAGTRGLQPAALPSFRTSGQQTFFTYNRNATGTGVRHRVSPQVSYYHRAFAALGEYVRSSGRIASTTGSAEVDHEAWQVAGAFTVTGEPATERGVRPANPFDPARGHFGAVQVAARYHVLTIDRAVVPLGLAGSGALAARAFAVGANWYLNPYVKWVVNVERTWFERAIDAARPTELLFLIRNQINF